MPKSAFPECYHSGNSRMLNWLLTCKLREFACALRKAFLDGQSLESIQMTKTKMLEEVHRILTIILGDPPATFDWSFRDKEKAHHSFSGLDPVGFYREMVGCSLAETVSLINDPRNEYYKLYTVEYLGNVAGGRAVAYINLPIEELKKYTIKSIQENQPGILRARLGLVTEFHSVVRM
jgi:bleomycin hydrolase